MNVMHSLTNCSVSSIGACDVTAALYTIRYLGEAQTKQPGSARDKSCLLNTRPSAAPMRLRRCSSWWHEYWLNLRGRIPGERIVPAVEGFTVPDQAYHIGIRVDGRRTQLSSQRF